MGLVVLVKKMSVLINFLLQNTNLVSVLSKSAQILLVMSDRTDTFRKLCLKDIDPHNCVYMYMILKI
jgi:hypothetical protein